VNSVGIRNELKVHAERERAEKAGRADAIVAAVSLFILAVYAVAAYIDQTGAFK
jgi:hypothetical protein